MIHPTSHISSRCFAAGTLTLLASFWVIGCTEPNPNLDGDGTGDTTSGTTSTSADTMSTSTATMGTSTTSGQTTGTTTDTDTGTTTGVSQCDDATHQCVEQPPPSWNGPITIIEDTPDDPDPTCDAAYPDLALTVFDEILAPSAMCTCECDPPTSVTCSSITLQHMSSGTCTNATSTDTVGTSCTSVTYAEGWWLATADLPNGTTCTPVESEELSEASFLTRLSACGGASDMGGCGAGQACLPTPPATTDGRVCIYAEGDLSCPPNSEYTEQVVYYGDIQDDRACSPCMCDDPEGGCTGSVALYNTDCGPPTQTAYLDPDICEDVNFQVRSATWTQDDFTADCTPNGGDPEGEATGSSPVTFCCR